MKNEKLNFYFIKIFYVYNFKQFDKFINNITRYKKSFFN